MSSLKVPCSRCLFFIFPPHPLLGTKLPSNTPVAIKFVRFPFNTFKLEKLPSYCFHQEPRKSDAPQLKDEFRSYRTLSGTPGVPQVHHFGQEGLHNVLVIDLLGPNLEDLFDMCGRKFSIKTVCMAAKQMVISPFFLTRPSDIYHFFIRSRVCKPFTTSL